MIIYEQQAALLGNRDDDVLLQANTKPSCLDDRGAGREVYVVVAHGGVGPLPDPNDPTEPERWPKIFPSGWASVDLLGAWTPGSYQDPQVSGRRSTVREVVLLPNPFDSPVRLDVERTEFRSLKDASVRQTVLTYSLATPHEAFTVDEGFISLKILSDSEDIGPKTEWRMLVGKRLVLTSPAYAAVSQLVCPQWLSLVSGVR